MSHLARNRGPRAHIITAVLATAATIFVGAPLSAQEPDGLAVAAAFERTLVEAIRRVEPSVVSVARIRPTAPSERLNVREFENDGRPEPDRPDQPDFIPNEFGAGIVIAPTPESDQRFILTNYHVVRSAPTAGTFKPPESQIYVR